MLSGARARAPGGRALTLLAWIAAGCAPSSRSADLVLTNGRVVTVDDDRPEAEAVAVSGHTILDVGTSEEMAAYVGAGTEVVDLEGRLVVPGLIEGHGHFLSLGRSRMILDLTAASSWEEIVALVGEAAARAPSGTWINGRGWHQEKWTSVPTPNVDGVPLHDALSAVSPDHPVLLGHASGHAAFANARALEEAGIGPQTPDPAGGTIVRGPEGRPTGLLRETAQRLVSSAQARAEEGRSAEERDHDFAERVRLAGEEALRNGVTSFHDAGASFDDIDRLRSMDAEGSLPVRLYVMVRRESNETMAERLADYRILPEGNGHLTVRSIKRQIDGALGSHGAWLLEPYDDLPSTAGLVLEEVEEIRRTAEIAIENGFQVNTHAIGDRANREVLDIYADVFSQHPEATDLRWRIEHAQHLHPDDVPRFAELGVIAAMQGIHATSDGPWIPRRLGEWRARTGAYLWRSLLDAGVVIGNGTDVPVERIDPIASYYATVSRMTVEGTRFYPDQKMTRMEALRSYTLNNAYAEFAEDRKGSITPGKLADLTVLSQDILTIPEERIPQTQVELTVVGGEIRYRRKEDGP
ncbi:MAG: amidohydrolase [Gemmatimonadetes bacterium]|nr:amidohydrolase [Gemmatimonadota bacterium]